MQTAAVFKARTGWTLGHLAGASWHHHPAGPLNLPTSGITSYRGMANLQNAAHLERLSVHPDGIPVNWNPICRMLRNVAQHTA